jgi:hypothetical protein
MWLKKKNIITAQRDSNPKKKVQFGYNKTDLYIITEINSLRSVINPMVMTLLL